MLSAHHRFFARSLFAVDLVILALATLVGRWFLHGTVVLDATAWLFLTVQLLCWWLLSVRLHVYHSRRTERLFREVVGIGEAVLLSTGLACGAAVAVRQDVPARIEVLLAVACTLLLLLRVGIRKLLRGLRARDLNFRQLLVIGRGSSAHRLTENIRCNPHYGLKVLGELTFEGEDSTAAIEGVKHLGVVADIQRVLAETAVDEVLVCPSGRTAMADVQAVLQLCEAIGTPCRLAPDFLTTELARPSVAWFGDVPTFTFFSGPGEPLALGVKRLTDLVGSLTGILLLTPVFVGCALAVKLTSKGPILFRQMRSGFRGRTFACYKFRSMVVDAEARQQELLSRNEAQGPVFKIKQDPRITPVGRFLRRYSMDELPQLFNVLLGDMSLVGPRPPLPSEVERYDWWQRRRLSVKPGLTCIWQVTGRNQVSFDRWMELDMEYIDGWCLALDFKLIAKTLGTVVRGTGM